MNDESGKPREASSRRLSGQDAVFLYTETASMPMHTLGTMILDPTDVPGGFGYEDVLRTVASRIHSMPPFRQRVLEVPLALGHPLLVDDPDFRLENHVHRLAVPAPGTLRELAEVVGDIAGRPLPRSQPMWEMTVVEGLEGGRLALVTKLHHCIIDGASGASQMAGLMDLSPDAAPPPAPAWNPPPLPGSLELARGAVGSRLVGPLALGRLVLHTAQDIRDRRRAQEELLGEGEDLPPWFGGAPRTSFNGAISPHRAVAYGGAPLEDIKRIKQAFGVTVNDAVLAAVSLALRRYLEARGELPDEPLVANIPVSTKSEAEKAELSVKVSGMGISLPTQLEDPAEVIRAVHRETSEAKQVFAAAEYTVIPDWLEIAPPLLLTAVSRLYSDLDLADSQEALPMNLAVSNMRGPPMPLYFGGAQVEAIYPMGPVAEGMGLNLTLLSNMGRLDVGVLACRQSVDDVWEIADGFTRAVEDLLEAAEKEPARA